MENAFDRLTPVQQLGINEAMFELAYYIVTTHKKEEDIHKAIKNETENYQNLKADLTRYCKLAKSVM